MLRLNTLHLEGFSWPWKCDIQTKNNQCDWWTNDNWVKALGRAGKHQHRGRSYMYHHMCTCRLLYGEEVPQFLRWHYCQSKYIKVNSWINLFTSCEWHQWMVCTVSYCFQSWNTLQQLHYFSRNKNLSQMNLTEN